MDTKFMENHSFVCKQRRKRRCFIPVNFDETNLEDFTGQSTLPSIENV